MNTSETSRRDFLAAGLLAGAALTGCSEKKNPFEIAQANGMIKPTGKLVKLLSVDGEVIEMDEAFLRPVSDLPPVSNAEARIGIPGKKFVMVVDLSRCKSVKACQTACNHAHELNPGDNWIKVYPMQEAEHTAPY